LNRKIRCIRRKPEPMRFGAASGPWSISMTSWRCCREQKKDFCASEGSILIDDLQSNIDAWEAYGGTGILHKDAEETMTILERMGVL